MDKNRTMIVVLAMLVGVSMGVEMQDGSFPIGSDYRAEKDRQGADPATYKKTYHRVIPGGNEHAEVVASNGPGSNSWSQTYSKHQSFGSADTMQSQSYSSSNNGKDASKAIEDAMARHNEIMSSIQQSMGMGLGGMGGIGMMPPPFGGSAESKLMHATSQMMFFDDYDQWMKNHMKMMSEIMRMQNAQFQTAKQIKKRPSSNSSPPRRRFRPTLEKTASTRPPPAEQPRSVDVLKTQKRLRRPSALSEIPGNSTTAKKTAF